MNFKVRVKKYAFVVEANNPDQIARKIIYILEHPAQVEEVTARGQEMCNHEFYYGNYVNQLFEFVKHICS